jgi:hypothetical protein
MSALDNCTDRCGWVAAFVAALAYGSYGVPIKHTKHIDVHPFVFQSYKTFVMFVTCWGVKFLGEDISFTRWGLLSGLMWIVGGVGGIYGIRMAGLAIAVGYVFTELWKTCDDIHRVGSMFLFHWATRLLLTLHRFAF